MDVLRSVGKDFKSASFNLEPRQSFQLPQGIRDFFHGSYDVVTCSVDNDMFALIPKGVFEPSRAREYLILSLQKELSDYQVLYDQVAAIDLVMVYAIRKEMYNALVSAFPSVVFRHYASVCLPYFLRRNSGGGNLAYVHLCTDAFYLIISQQGKLQLCNRYIFRAPEDILYYLLFALEQSGMSPENTSLILGGTLSENGSAAVLLREFFDNIDLDEIENTPAGGMQFQGAFINQYLCA